MDRAPSIRSMASSGPGTAGALARDLPAFAAAPPIEAVVFGWGVSEDGQLGLDARDDVLAPKVVEALLGTRFRGREFGRSPLVAGSRGSLAIDADGRLLTWGWNARGTLGHGDCAPGPKPRRVAGALRDTRIVQAALGGWHCLAVDEAGRAWAWGGNEYGQCGFPPAPRPAVPSSGAGAPGGRGGWTAAGVAAPAPESSAPSTPAAAGAEGRDVASPIPVVPDLEVVQVSAGGMQSAALTAAGDVWVWGEPWGDFSVVLSRAPRPIPVPAPVAKVACGAFHTLALTVDGAVYAWGANDFGQLGTGDTSPAVAPAPVAGLEGEPVADVGAGGWHSLALGTDGGVHVWGRGEYGRLGLGAAEGGASRLRATRLAALDGAGVVQASAGGTHTVALTADGTIYAWGRGSFGRLGTGDEADRHAPVRVRLPGGPGRWHAVCVSAGGRHTLALALPDNGNLDGGGRAGGGSDDGGRAGAAPSPPPPPPPPQPPRPRSNAPAASPAGNLARAPPPENGNGGGLVSDDDDDDASQPDDAVAAPEGVDGASDAGGEAAAEAQALAPPPLRLARGGGESGDGGGGGPGGVESSAAPTPGGRPASDAGDAEDDDDEGDEPVLDPAHGLAAAMARAALSHSQLEAAAREMHRPSGEARRRSGGGGRPPRGATPPSRLGGGA